MTTCDLTEFNQWDKEKGYWVGDLSFFGADGAPMNDQEYWNFPYDHYKGFIVGQVQNNHYQQRNIFFYPPQTQEKCEIFVETTDSENGVCGVNGNIKMFFADQQGSCESQSGTIEGVFAGSQYTWSSLHGQQDDSVLYEVYDNIAGDGPVSQKQLTTLHTVNGVDHRTRTAQGFNPDGTNSYASFYRERKVSKEEFYKEMNRVIEDYAILDEDLKMNGPGKYFKVDMEFVDGKMVPKPDPEWAKTVQELIGSAQLFEAFLETAHDFPDVEDRQIDTHTHQLYEQVSGASTLFSKLLGATILLVSLVL